METAAQPWSIVTSRNVTAIIAPAKGEVWVIEFVTTLLGGNITVHTSGPSLDLPFSNFPVQQNVRIAVNEEQKITITGDYLFVSGMKYTGIPLIKVSA